MKTLVAEFPKHPLPHVPQPQGPQHPRIQPPTVYVYEKQAWEYRVVTKNVADDATVREDALNAVGSEGWELVGVVPLPSKVQFVFKRMRS